MSSSLFVFIYLSLYLFFILLFCVLFFISGVSARHLFSSQQFLTTCSVACFCLPSAVWWAACKVAVLHYHCLYNFSRAFFLFYIFVYQYSIYLIIYLFILLCFCFLSFCFCFCLFVCHFLFLLFDGIELFCWMLLSAFISLSLFLWSDCLFSYVFFIWEQFVFNLQLNVNILHFYIFIY